MDFIWKLNWLRDSPAGSLCASPEKKELKNSYFLLDFAMPGCLTSGFSPLTDEPLPLNGSTAARAVLTRSPATVGRQGVIGEREFLHRGAKLEESSMAYTSPGRQAIDAQARTKPVVASCRCPLPKAAGSCGGALLPDEILPFHRRATTPVVSPDCYPPAALVAVTDVPSACCTPSADGSFSAEPCRLPSRLFSFSSPREGLRAPFSHYKRIRGIPVLARPRRPSG